MSTKKVLYNLVVVLAMVILASCSAAGTMPSGEVYTAGIKETINALAACLRQDIGTGIISDGKSIVFAFREGPGWGFAGFNIKGEALYSSMKQANITTYTDGDQMIQGWVNQGWKFMSPRELPPQVLDAIAMNVGAFAATLSTFLVLPLGVIDPAQYGATGNPVNE